jgi:DNA mismatch repair ATPase MutS
MKFSLLYKNYIETFNDGDNPLLEDMSNTLYDLSIDKALNEFSRNSESMAYAMEVLKNPLKTVEEIKYRQDILLDFIEMPKLLDELRTIFANYDTLQNEWREMRSGIYVYGVPNTSGGILDATYESLKITAAFARKTVSYFRSIYEAVDKYAVVSEGLKGIKQFCAEMTANASLDEISGIASMFMRDTVAAYRFKVRSHMDDTLKIISASLSDAAENEEKSLSRSMKKLIGTITKTNPPPDETPEADLGEFHLEESRNILNEALYELYSALSGITGNIYEFFRGLSGELSFYDTGVRYVRRLVRSQAPMCVPEILPLGTDSFKAEELYDVQLLLEGMETGDIVKNELEITACDGVLIRGLNSTGKTCTLRAIGAAQLFAQAGLPICAKSASVSIRGGVFCQFSSAEKDFDAADAAGRFEGEVKELSRIINDLVPHSLVLLNETFQTTAYSEGAEGMRDILEALPLAGAGYIFVTHMPIFDKMDSGRVKKLQFGEDYKIREI